MTREPARPTFIVGFLRERHYTAEVEAYKAQLRELQQECAAVSRTLMRLPNKMEKAAARLREWRWKLVNFVAVFKTKLSPDKQLPGYDDLDEIVAAYRKWRDVNIQKAATAQLAAVPTLRGNSVTVGDRLANSEATSRLVRWRGGEAD